MNSPFVKSCVASYPEEAGEFFDLNHLDAFQDETVLTGLHGRSWSGLFASTGTSALLHSVVPKRIGATNLFDVEQWYGYAGPLFAGSEVSDYPVLLQAYSRWCAAHNIVCELIRFDPYKHLETPFRHAHGHNVVYGRSIALIDLTKGPDCLLGSYTSAARRQIASANRRFFVKRMLGTASDWSAFIELYYRSLDRVGATRRWYFDKEFFERSRRVPFVSLWAVYDGHSHGDVPVAATYVVTKEQVLHTLLVANLNNREYGGACDLLMHAVASHGASAGNKVVCLGGGRSASTDDSLFRFKAKFSSNYVEPLPLGFIVHMKDCFEHLVETSPSGADSSLDRIPSSDVVARFMPYRLADKYLNIDAMTIAERSQ